MPARRRRSPENEVTDAPSGKKPFKPAGKSGLIADLKGRRVLVQRTGSEEAAPATKPRPTATAPPRVPSAAITAKRDLKPRDE